MNINQAFKLKQTLIGKISSNFSLIRSQNSIESGNIRRYVVAKIIEDTKDLINQLSVLKEKIHRANDPVYGKIFLIGELRGLVATLKLMPVDEGKKTSTYGQSPQIFESEINILERDKMVEDLEKQIEEIQNELDIHNATTQIE